MNITKKNQAKIKTILTPTWQSEGVDSKVLRSIGTSKVRNFDPFLMLDYFHSTLPSGFPDHPHRGFETVTYCLEGSIYHEDFKGHKGEVKPHGVQWMTAGKGIVHAEMPSRFDKITKGFQLWINLPKKDKMCNPKYQEFDKEEISFYQKDGIEARIISGEVFGMKGVVDSVIPIEYIDFFVKTNKSFFKKIRKGINAFIYLYEGSLQIGDQIFKKNTTVFFDNSDEVKEVFLKGVDNGRFLWISGEPIGEEIVQYGPFVMNTQKEIYQTIEDFRNCKNGFEPYKNWQSSIQHLAKKKY